MPQFIVQQHDSLIDQPFAQIVDRAEVVQDLGFFDSRQFGKFGKRAGQGALHVQFVLCCQNQLLVNVAPGWHRIPLKTQH
ncbi:hypothetical protein D3C72_2408370 [compost metagenome]